MNSILQIINLRCVRQQRFLFEQLSFELKSGEVLLIEGANGSGKSSLLRLLTGLATPSEGEIHWQNNSIHTHPELYKKDLHYLSHANGIKLGLTVAENLQLAEHLNLSASPNLMDEVLAEWQLSNFKHTIANHLSAGQKRRVALAKLILYPRALWILDEPLTALDAQTQTLFLSALEKHLKNKGIAILSSHHAITLPSAETEIEIKKLRLSSC